MIGTDVNPYPILLLVNYWEIHPSLMGARLNGLLKRGFSHFATFVPWQATESDISHTLTRLLQAAAERRMSVHLILSPEVGVHYPHSGLPKDIVSNKENMAHHSQTGEVIANLPPNSFALPSFFSPEFNKRYYGFLTRMDGYFADLTRTQPELLQNVTVVLSGSFWKYYRCPAVSAQMTFGGQTGDYSSHSALAFRQRVEQFYSQREFLEPNPSAANRWKTRTMEETNRKWFYQQAEDVFRYRSLQSLRKKSRDLKTIELEIYTPEADPSLVYSNFLQAVSGSGPDFSRLSGLLDEISSRVSYVSSNVASSFVHWSCVGRFKLLSEAQRQFLLLKSLLLLGSQGGGVLVDESDWLSLSPAFRVRAESLARSLHQSELQSKNRVLYLTPYLWSSYGALWEELVSSVGTGAKMISSMDLLLREKSAHLLIVDPSFIITQDVVQRLVGWAKAGKIVVLPRSQLYTEPARRELDQVVQQTKKIHVDLGLAYSLHSLGAGKLILFDVSDQSWMRGEPLFSWQGFLKSVLSVAEVSSFCHVKDGRVSALSFEGARSNLGVFLLNGSRQAIRSEISFPNEVQIGDLGVALAGSNPSQVTSNRPKAPAAGGATAEPAAYSSHYALDIPAYGILPLSVEGMNLADLKERQLAAMTSQFTHDNVMSAASTELPGFSADENTGEQWS